MIEASVKEAANQKKVLKTRPLLIGVTVLTSQASGTKDVLGLARLGLVSGLDGIVCSAHEAKLLRSKIKNKFLIVTPGIRAGDSSRDDQKRIATALEAQSSGSDYLVIGRPILKADNPVLKVEEILGDLYGRRN